MDNLGYALFVLAVWAVAVARVTRLVNFDAVLDPVRIKLGERFGTSSTLIYFIGCVWCVSIWVAFGTAWIPILLTDLSWWFYPLIALAASHLAGIASPLSEDTLDYTES